MKNNPMLTTSEIKKLLIDKYKRYFFPLLDEHRYVNVTCQVRNHFNGLYFESFMGLIRVEDSDGNVVCINCWGEYNDWKNKRS